MTGKDLLIAFGDISHKYYDEAENDTITQVRKTLRRPLLIAAVIALMLLLVGCAVVYALRLQDMSIGQETYTQRFDDTGKAIEPIEKTRDIITIYGHNGDPIQLALKEWYEFLETYDPEGELMTNDPQLPEIPDQYEYTYSCYTQDMVDKVDEIAQKYGLKLLDTWIPFQQYQSDIFLEETGIHSLLVSGSSARLRYMAGMLYPPYNFHMEFQLVTESDSNGLWASYFYARKDYFPRSFPGGVDLSNYQQWDHTAPDGTKLLLALSNKGNGYVIAEPENAMLIISIDGNRSNSAYPEASEIITREELESIADMFDYSIQPQEVNRAAVEEKLEAAETAYQAEHTYVPEVYSSFNEYLMGSVYTPDHNRQYTFYDLTGDGEDELLLGYNGTYTDWLTIRDGEVVWNACSETYLCEGRVIERYSALEELWDYEQHMYITLTNDTAIEDADGEYQWIATVGRREDQWYQCEDIYGLTENEISAEDAAAVIAKYPRIELDWKPLMDYPLDADGYTLWDYLQDKDVRVSDDELNRIYTDFLANRADPFYTHCRILDINGDGVKDLLLSGDGEKYWEILTYRYGSLNHIPVWDFYLCEDNVLEHVSMYNMETGVEVNATEFLRCNGFDQETLDFVAYNKATASWQSDYKGTPMPEADAQAILAKYPRIDQGMQPISELLY